MGDILSSIIDTIVIHSKDILDKKINRSEFIYNVLDPKRMIVMFNESNDFFVDSTKITDMEQYESVIKNYNIDKDKFKLTFYFNGDNYVLRHVVYVADILMQYYESILLSIKDLILDNFGDVKDIVFYIGEIRLLLTEIMLSLFNVSLQTKKEDGHCVITMAFNERRNHVSDVKMSTILSSSFNLNSNDMVIAMELIFKDNVRKFILGTAAFDKFIIVMNLLDLTEFVSLKVLNNKLKKEQVEIIKQSMRDVIAQFIHDVIGDDIKYTDEYQNNDLIPIAYNIEVLGVALSKVNVIINKKLFNNINDRLLNTYNISSFNTINTLGVNFMIKMDQAKGKIDIDNIHKLINYDYVGTSAIRDLMAHEETSQHVDSIIQTVYDIQKILNKCEQYIIDICNNILNKAYNIEYLQSLFNNLSELVSERMDNYLNSIISNDTKDLSFMDILTILVYKEQISSEVTEYVSIVGGDSHECKGSVQECTL